MDKKLVLLEILKNLYTRILNHLEDKSIIILCTLCYMLCRGEYNKDISTKIF